MCVQGGLLGGKEDGSQLSIKVRCCCCCVGVRYFLGNKVLAVFGRVGFYGQPVPVTWTRLGAPAIAGTTSITLAQPVTWSVGQVMISLPEPCPDCMRFSSLLPPNPPPPVPLCL